MLRGGGPPRVVVPETAMYKGYALWCSFVTFRNTMRTFDLVDLHLPPP